MPLEINEQGADGRGEGGGLFIHTNAWQRPAPERPLLSSQTFFGLIISLSEMTKGYWF